MRSFLLDFEGNQHLRPDLEGILPIIRDLAKEFADVYLPMHAIFAAETVCTPCTEFSGDGVHPSEGGSCFIAERVLHAIEPILTEWIENQ